MLTRPANVLLVAYACRPGESSEREVGWKWANLIRQCHNVTVLTRETHRVYIESFEAKRPDGERGPEFIYYDLPEWLSRFKRGERGLYLYYIAWSLFAIIKARRMNRDRRWEITHFLTFGTLLWPQFAFLMNTRYVLGPVGGGERIPFSLRRSFNFVGQMKLVFRHAFQMSLYLNPVHWCNLVRADVILARTRETSAIIPKRFQQKTQLMLETALPDGIPSANSSSKSDDTLEIVSVGRLIASKINPLMLEVLAEFREKWNRPFRMTIVGDGPERKRLESLRDSLGLEEVVFVGKKPSEEVYSRLLSSDIYFSTTMKEGGTWAFFEAIGCGLPVVCLKVNGPDMIVGDECGVKVEARNYRQTQADLVRGLIELADDPKLRETYAARAIAYVHEHYNWDQVQERVNQVYEAALAGHSEGVD